MIPPSSAPCPTHPGTPGSPDQPGVPPDQGSPGITTVHSGPIDRGARSLGPDLARGVLLLFIALANVWGFLNARPMGAGYRPLTDSPLDHVVDGLTAFLADDRSWPMFSTLYGFGLSMIVTRLGARGVSPGHARRVVLRRSWGLVAIGAVHSALLFGGDILFFYGVMGLLALAFVQRPARVLRRWFVAGLVGVVAAVVVTAVETVGDRPPYPAPGGGSSDYLTSVVDRVAGSLAGSLLLAACLVAVPTITAGVLIHRAGWLQQPWLHRRTLGRCALWASVVNLVMNLPWALEVGGVWRSTGVVSGLVSAGHDLSGQVMGLGYVCLFGWLAARWRGRPRGVVLSAITAVGERSMTCYLLQSVALAPLLSPWGLDLGARLRTAQAAGIAVLVWVGTACVALALHRAGRRGPFEVFMRRIAYGEGARRAVGPTSASEIGAAPQPSVG